MVALNTVLIVDDEPDSCLLWKAFLSQRKFEVFTAVTLAEGLRLAGDVKPAVIVLDNNLPDGLGWDHVQDFFDRVPECKINLISAYSSGFKPPLNDNIRILEKPLTLSGMMALLV